MFYDLSRNKKIITIFHLKTIIFTAVKNRCISNRRVCVMWHFISFMLRACMFCTIRLFISRAVCLSEALKAFDYNKGIIIEHSNHSVLLFIGNTRLK